MSNLKKPELFVNILRKEEYPDQLSIQNEIDKDESKDGISEKESENKN